MIKSTKELDEFARDMSYEIWLGGERDRRERIFIQEELASLSPLTPSEVKALKERVMYHCPDRCPSYNPSEEFVSSEVNEFLSRAEVRDSNRPVRDEFAHLNDVQDRGEWFMLPNGELFRCTQARRTDMCANIVDNRFYAKRGITENMFSKAVKLTPLQAANAAIDAVYFDSSPIIREPYFGGDLSPYYGDSVVARIDYEGDSVYLTKHLKGEEPKTYKLDELSDDELRQLTGIMENVRCAEEVAEMEKRANSAGNDIHTTIGFDNERGNIVRKSYSEFEFDEPFPVFYENHRSMIATKIEYSRFGISVVGIDSSEGVRRERAVPLDQLSEKGLDKVLHATDVVLKNYLKDHEKMQKEVVNALDRYPSRIGGVSF